MRKVGLKNAYNITKRHIPEDSTLMKQDDPVSNYVSKRHALDVNLCEEMLAI